MKKWIIFSAALIFVVWVAMPFTQADEDGHSASLKKEDGHTASLKKEDGHTASLEKKLQHLEAEMEKLTARLAVLEAFKPTFTSFMPEFSERFHVMHLAGDAGDWAVAAHELVEMKRMVKIAKLLDPVKGPMMQAFMGPQLEKIDGAIDHGNRKSFRKALVNTVKSCNACHTAAGSPFIKVALDVKQVLSMRHSHLLKKSKVMKGHAH